MNEIRKERKKFLSKVFWRVLFSKSNDIKLPLKLFPSFRKKLIERYSEERVVDRFQGLSFDQIFIVFPCLYRPFSDSLGFFILEDQVVFCIEGRKAKDRRINRCLRFCRTLEKHGM